MSLAEFASWLDGHRRSIDAIQHRFRASAGEVAAQNYGPWVGDEQLKDAAGNLRLVRGDRCHAGRFRRNKAQI